MTINLILVLVAVFGTTPDASSTPRPSRRHPLTRPASAITTHPPGPITPDQPIRHRADLATPHTRPKPTPAHRPTTASNHHDVGPNSPNLASTRMEKPCPHTWRNAVRHQGQTLSAHMDIHLSLDTRSGLIRARAFDAHLCQSSETWKPTTSVTRQPLGLSMAKLKSPLVANESPHPWLARNAPR